MNTHTFKFSAHVVGTDRTVEVAITMPEDDRPIVDIADDAEEKALAQAAQLLGTEEKEIEMVEV